MYVVTLSVFHNLAIWLLYVNKPEPDAKRPPHLRTAIRPYRPISVQVQFDSSTTAGKVPVTAANVDKYCHRLIDGDIIFMVFLAKNTTIYLNKVMLKVLSGTLFPGDSKNCNFC